MWDNIIKEKKTDMEGCKCKPAKSFAQRIIEYQEFVSLVKRMREAQKREWEIKSKQTCGKELDEHTEVVTKLESEADEYLKKMEGLK